jgi:proline iminopeptidase
MLLTSVSSPAAQAQSARTRGGAQQTRETVLDRVVTVHDSLFTKIPQLAPLCDSEGILATPVSVEDATLHVEAHGGGPVIVLVSGGPGSTHNIFHPWFTRAASFSRVIYYDQRGTGRSDFAPGEEGYSVDQAVEDLDQLRSELGLEKWIVLGHSYGGFLAQYYTLRYPGRVAGLVLVGASPNMWEYDETTRQFSYMPREQLDRVVEVRREVAAWSDEAGLEHREATALSVYNAFLNGDWKRQYFYRPTREQISRIALHGWNPDPAGFRQEIQTSMDPIDLTGAFEGSPIPTLILEGRRDLTWQEDKAEALHANHPGSDLVMFERAAHSPFMDEPDRFFEVLESFVANLSSVSPNDIDTYRGYITRWDRRVKSSVQFLLRTTGDDAASYGQIAGAYSSEWLPQLARSNDYFWHLQKVGFALYEVRRTEKAAGVFRTLQETANTDPDPQNIALYVGLVWEGHMLDLLGRRAAAIERYREAADLGIEGYWSHPQYRMNFEFTPYAEERLATPFQRVANVDGP